MLQKSCNIDHYRIKKQEFYRNFCQYRYFKASMQWMTSVWVHHVIAHKACNTASGKSSSTQFCHNLQVRKFTAWQTWGQIVSKVFKCKCKYFQIFQMQILLFSSNANANTFQKYFKCFSNTFKYFDRYAISIKT